MSLESKIQSPNDVEYSPVRVWILMHRHQFKKVICLNTPIK